MEFLQYAFFWKDVAYSIRRLCTITQPLKDTVFLQSHLVFSYKWVVSTNCFDETTVTRWTWVCNIDTVENLIIAIVKPLISQPDALTIKIEDTPEFLEYHLDLDQSDVGRVIGRKGRTISAIRTIVYSVPTEYKKVRIVIDEK